MPREDGTFEVQRRSHVALTTCGDQASSLSTPPVASSSQLSNTGSKNENRMSEQPTRETIADLIVARLDLEKHALESTYRHEVAPHFVVDNLLPQQLATDIYTAFPSVSQMRLRKSLRERKYVTAQMNTCARLAEEALFAFHDPRIVKAIQDITGLRQVEADPLLYAGGISVMTRGHFLNPHIDNSHDKSRARYRVLNLLYYVTPNWHSEDGGSLELWPDGPRGTAITIPAPFNRLVVMATDRSAWHSVNRVRCDMPRCCVSNYYFSAISPEETEYFHVTSFRERPEQPLRDAVLRIDAKLRMTLRNFRPGGSAAPTHN